MRFHISCCGRSGSKYVTAALKAMGLSVLHEMGDDWPFPQKNGIAFVAKNPSMFSLYQGIVGWKWSLLTPKYAAKATHQFHLVRHPLRAIESATTHADSLFSLVERHLGEADFLTPSMGEEDVRLGRAINYWIAYNQAFDQDKAILRLESFAKGGESLNLFCDVLGIRPEVQDLVAFLPADINERKKAKRRVSVTKDLLLERFPDQYEILRKLGESYGYDM